MASSNPTRSARVNDVPRKRTRFLVSDVETRGPSRSPFERIPRRATTRYAASGGLRALRRAPLRLRERSASTVQSESRASGLGIEHLRACGRFCEIVVFRQHDSELCVDEHDPFAATGPTLSMDPHASCAGTTTPAWRVRAPRPSGPRGRFRKRVPGPYLDSEKKAALWMAEGKRDR